MPQVPHTPKVSLLIPVYNVQRYLRECMDSALAQTLHDIEVICVNDGSTDASRQILDEYLSDPRVRVIDKPNSGYGATMNRALAAAQGTYVGILESDDFLEPDALETLYEAAQRTQAEVSKGDFFLFWSTPTPRDERFGWIRPSEAKEQDPRAFTNVFYRKPSLWSALYERSFLEREHIRFLETPGASFQDASFNFKVWASARRVVLVDRAVVHYRQDNEASSVNSSAKALCVCDEGDEIMRFVEARSDAAELAPIAAKVRFDSYLWNYERLASELRPAFAARMAQDLRKEDERGIAVEALLEPWKVVDRRAIIADPEAFCRSKEEGAAYGKLAPLLRCYRAGGFPLVVKAIRSKVRNEHY